MRNAKLRFTNERVDIAIENGVIKEIGKVYGTHKLEINVKGNLVTESFVNPHLHLCKYLHFSK
ncbi:putative hydrolase [Caldisericum exile]|uniref:Hydrolase n=1 Tax=Caldisericum exile (strain DSM 21853 / NBRC 104410 / AZM16c01) TaxID=511051 RepID=A0A7U6GDG2_CALEA|nr:putative hydrolase [Caldisericum exile]BAL80320.1 putative hydrolase [Caldisericum exile AZM16c01]